MKKVLLLALIGFTLSTNAQIKKKKVMPAKKTEAVAKKSETTVEGKAVVDRKSVV